MGEMVSTIGDMFQRAAGIYDQVEATRTRTMLAKAQASTLDFASPTAYMNPQAKAAQAVEVPGVGTLTGTGLLLAGLVFGAAVYLAVR